MRASARSVAQHPAGVEAEILVLDNRSDDGSLELLEELARRPDGGRRS